MKQILITGSTGVLGSELVPVLLNDPNTTVHLLIRAKDKGHLQTRLTKLFEYWNFESEGPESCRIRAYCGDVCQPRLGLDQQQYQLLTMTLTNIVHSAGNVKLNQPLSIAREHAVTSVENIIELAWACYRTGQFEKLEAVSTVGVAGCMPGLIPEERLNVPPSFHNSYEQAKAEAEETLWSNIDKGLPITIHRPSMIVGDSQTGRILQFQVFYYLCEFLSGRKTFGIVPEMGDAKLDIIPVDYVAKAISTSCRDSTTAGRVFHLCSGPESSPRLCELSNVVRTIYESHGTRLPKLRTWPLSRFKSACDLFALVGPRQTRRAIATLPHFLEYLEAIQAFEVRYSIGKSSAIRDPICLLEVVILNYIKSRCDNLAATDKLMPSGADKTASGSLP